MDDKAKIAHITQKIADKYGKDRFISGNCFEFALMMARTGLADNNVYVLVRKFYEHEDMLEDDFTGESLSHVLAFHDDDYYDVFGSGALDRWMDSFEDLQGDENEWFEWEEIDIEAGDYKTLEKDLSAMMRQYHCAIDRELLDELTEFVGNELLKFKKNPLEINI